MCELEGNLCYSIYQVSFASPEHLARPATAASQRYLQSIKQARRRDRRSLRHVRRAGLSNLAIMRDVKQSKSFFNSLLGQFGRRVIGSACGEAVFADWQRAFVPSSLVTGLDLYEVANDFASGVLTAFGAILRALCRDLAFDDVAQHLRRWVRRGTCWTACNHSSGTTWTDFDWATRAAWTADDSLDDHEHGLGTASHHARSEREAGRKGQAGTLQHLQQWRGKCRRTEGSGPWQGSTEGSAATDLGRVSCLIAAVVG